MYAMCINKQKMKRLSNFFPFDFDILVLIRKKWKLYISILPPMTGAPELQLQTFTN